MQSQTQFVKMLRTTSRAGRCSHVPGKHRRLSLGFTLLELMIVISIMMILMAVAVPLYQHHVIEAREAVLKQNLYQLNSLIEQYRMDKGQSPQALDDLVPIYLPKLPVDPMTEKADWVPEQEDPTNAVDPNQPGILKVHSASQLTPLAGGEPYSSW